MEEITTPTETYSVFSPIFLLTRTCCFLPVKIRSSGKSTTISWSWKYYLASVSAFACMVTWIVFGLSRSYSIKDVYDIRLNQMSAMCITILDDCYLLLTFTLATLMTPITFTYLCTYLMCLHKADDLLECQVKGEKIKCSIVLFLTLTITIFILGLDMVAWWNHVFSKHIDVGLYLLYNLPFYYTYFLVMVIEMNYWYLVQMVNVRLANINDELVREYTSHNKNEQKYLISVPSTKKISTIIKVYELLYQASDAVNSFYGLNILLVLIGCFIHLLVTPYDLHLELKVKGYTFIFPQICWMISHILRLLLVVEPCHTASQLVKRTTVLVRQFLLLELPQDIYSQVDKLAAQLFHCPIQYTGHDYIVLDRSFLIKIIGGVTTYMVILFEFEN